jgi:signal transduction histidine kinase
MPHGGRLRVDVRENPEAGMAEVRIADTGVGIAAEALRELSQPFVTTKAQGSGLGLFLTRRLLESAGGRLEITSEVGRGTTVTVALPRR